MTNETQKPDEQPYFNVKVTRCGECPHYSREHALCKEERVSWSTDKLRIEENRNGITPSCPMWAQRVQQEKQE